MARSSPTPRLAQTEDAVIGLFCLADDAHRPLDSVGARCREGLKRLSSTRVLTPALLQLRCVESECPFLRDPEWFFPHPFPGVVGLPPPRCTSA